MAEPTTTSTKTPAKGGKSAAGAVKSGARAPRPRAAKSEAGARAAAGAAASALSLSPDERRRLISERAYLRAERRGFQGGDTVADWLAAEAEVDRLAESADGQAA